MIPNCLYRIFTIFCTVPVLLVGVATFYRPDVSGFGAGGDRKFVLSTPLPTDLRVHAVSCKVCIGSLSWS